MKTLQLYSFFIIFFLFFFSRSKLFASHGAGGEIYYTWVSDSTYTFNYHFYRDCTGLSEPPYIQLCAYNICNNSSLQIELNKKNTPGNGTPVILCNGDTKCTNPASTVIGCEEWLYSRTYTMPSQCDKWQFLVETPNRNPNNNLSVSGKFISLAFFNNTANYRKNSSPYFNSEAIYYMCVNQPVSLNNNAIDPDGDSLVTEVIYPIDEGACNFQTTSNAKFIQTNPPYNITNNPIQTNNTFTLNPSTGQMQFTPALIGSSAMAIRVSEYRDGILIGWTIRDIQFQITPCNLPLPTITLSPPVGKRNDTIIGCPGIPLSFCVSASSISSSAKIVILDDVHASLPGSTVSHSNPLTDSTIACYLWTPLSTGRYILNVNAVDSQCSPSVPKQSSKKIYFIIGKTPSVNISVSPDTNISSGQPVTFSAIVNNCTDCNYQWKKNGLNVPAAIESKWITNKVSDMDVVTCELHCNDNCLQYRDILSNSITMHVSKEPYLEFDSIFLFPNPNNGNFTISGFSTENTDIQVKIFTLLGQEIWHFMFDTNKGLFTQNIHTDNLSCGQYMVRVKTIKTTSVFKITVCR